MRATTLLLSAALTLCGTASFAQSSYNIVVEPVGQTIDSIIHAPIEYDDRGVVKAQHFNADNLTEEEYQLVLDEAERVRAYRDANGLNFESDYVSTEYIDSGSTTYGSTHNSVSNTSPSYQMELFAPETPSYSVSTPAAATYTTSAAKLHTVSKGQTLYSISKLYGVSIPAIQAENGITSTVLSIGQDIRIPGTTVQSSTVGHPIYATAPKSYNSGTRRIVVEPTPSWNSSGIETSIASEAIYAVLPKDTLYAISRRTCVGVNDIISRNAISNPNSLTPGQELTLPAGHCLAR